MDKLYAIFITIFLVSCGGGGTSTGLLVPESQGSSPPASPSYWLYGKAIDGYIDGATVFIDFNWNLIQDEGEPTALTDSEGTYYFTNDNGEFNNINNVTTSCARSRPVVVNVPVGATDTTRGYIDTAFDMYLIPTERGSDILTNIPSRGNISPFTGLFLEYINEAKQTYNYVSISVEEGCGTDADNIADFVFSKTAEFEADLYTAYNITFDHLYNDFIASDNAEWIGRAETIVDFLQLLAPLRTDLDAVLEGMVGEEMPSSLYISDSALGQVIGTPELNALAFNMRAHFTGADIGGWSNYFFLETSETTLNRSDGTLGNGYAPTYASLKQHAEKYRADIGGVSTTAVIDFTTSYTIREEIEDGFCANDYTLRYMKEDDTYVTEYNISHHNGLDYEAYCTIVDLPTNVTVEYTQKKDNRNDHYSFSISVDPSVSQIVPNVPVTYSDIDYNGTLGTIQGIVLTYDEVDGYQSILQSNEFIALGRTLIDGVNIIEKAYFVYPTYTQCIHRTFDGTDWVTVDSGTTNAYNNCREFITNFYGE